MIDNALGDKTKSKRFREEFIHNWIETQLINLDAINKGVDKTKKYNLLIESAKIDVANSIVVNNILMKNPIEINDKQLENYYINNFKEFQIVSPKVLYNKALFMDREKAQKFRNLLLKIGWQKALLKVNNKDFNISFIENKSEFVYNISDQQIKDYFLSKNIRNISPIIKVSPTLYVVINLIKRNNKNDLLEFEEVKEEVRQKYITIKRKEIYNNYLKKLFSEYSSEIER